MAQPQPFEDDTARGRGIRARWNHVWGRRGTRRREGALVVLALLLCLLSGVGASAVQTSFGGVAVEDMRWKTASGQTLSALLYTPDAATESDPAPAVVVTHGWYDSREKHGNIAVELARRGFVVLAIDMYGHGNSSPLIGEQVRRQGTGVYDGVELIAGLPYVDTDRIGVVGHSNGARATNYAVMADEDARLISSVLILSNNVFYERDGDYANRYGTRDVGLLATEYDEVFFRHYDDEGRLTSPPREFIGSDDAQSFLHFGADPATFDDVREPGTYYTQRIDGEDAQRVLFTTADTHAWVMMSPGSIGSVVDFFDETLGAPAPAAPAAQVWPIKEAFTTLGLVGFGLFLVAFPRLLVHTRAFGSLRRTPPPMLAPTRAGWVWFWVTLSGGALVAALVWYGLSAFTYAGMPIMPPPEDIVPGESQTMAPVLVAGIWACVNGAVTIGLCIAAYFGYWRRRRLRPRDYGAFIDIRSLGKTLALALITVVAAFAIVGAVDYLFTTDFRFWLLAVKWFTPDKIPLALAMLPLFAVYYVANSIAINVFNRFPLAGREWLNTAVLALFNAAAPLLLLALQYITLYTTGEVFPGLTGSFSMWLFQIVGIVTVAAIISRKLYTATGNPYLGGFVNALAVAMISVSNTLVSTG